MDWWEELNRLMRERPAPPRRAERVIVAFAKPDEDGARWRNGRSRPTFDPDPSTLAETQARKEAAADIRAGLLHCVRRADAAGLYMLAYLIECAALEAKKRNVR